MIHPPVRAIGRPALFLLIAFILLATGCYYPTEPRRVYPPEANVSTALVIVMEGECTEADYWAWRGKIMNYLIEQRYIANESELVSDPANADRVVRAIVSGGSYSLAVFYKNEGTEPVPALETTDILYPADPYFIFGFVYMYDFGPQPLPPRPPGYHPHPRPLHEGPPPGRPVYDHDRHWSHHGQHDRDDGQPKSDEGRHAAPPASRPHDENRPQPDHASPPQKPDNHPRPQPDQKPESNSGPQPNNHPTPPPAGEPPKPGDHARPDDAGHQPQPSVPPKSADHPQPSGADHRPGGNPPAANRPPPAQPAPAPAPARPNAPDAKAPPVPDKIKQDN